MDAKQQQQLDFDSPLKDKLAKISAIAALPFDEYSPGRIKGVVELLSRLAVLMQRTGQQTIKIHRSTLAGGIHGRRQVSDRTVSRWAADAEALGLIDRVCTSQQYGGHHFNIYVLHWHKVDQFASSSPADSGLTRVDTEPGRVDTVTPPRLDTASPPLIADPLANPRNGYRRPSPSIDFELADWPELAELADVSIEPKAANRVRGGQVFEPLKTWHLANPTTMFEWFRAQSAVSSPILPPNALNATLCLSSALFCAQDPKRDISSPVGFFASIVTRRLFRQTLGHVPEALRVVNRAIEDLIEQ